MAGVIKRALLAKSREAALTAVQTYNNPLVRFKSESFIVLMTIAWTYLMHAYYARLRVDYRYVDKDPQSKRRYMRSAQGGYKWWELATCIKVTECPLDRGTVNNLDFLLGLRHEIEHHRPPHLDDHMSGRYLACALNYDYWLTTLFGERLSLGQTVAMALQFRELRAIDNPDVVRLPGQISRYIERFEGGMSQEEFYRPRFAYRLMVTRKGVSKKGQADRAVEFIKPGDPGSEAIEPDRWLIKDTERRKYRPTDVVAAVREAGYAFGIQEHTLLWQNQDAKDPARGFGAWVANQWFWYESWVDACKAYCLARDEGRIAKVS